MHIGQTICYLWKGRFMCGYTGLEGEYFPGILLNVVIYLCTILGRCGVRFCRCSLYRLPSFIFSLFFFWFFPYSFFLFFPYSFFILSFHSFIFLSFCLLYAHYFSKPFYQWVLNIFCDIKFWIITIAFLVKCSPVNNLLESETEWSLILIKKESDSQIENVQGKEWINEGKKKDRDRETVTKWRQIRKTERKTEREKREGERKKGGEKVWGGIH